MMQWWDEEVASAPLPYQQVLLGMRDGVARLRSRFPKAYSFSTKGELYDEMRRSYDHANEMMHRVRALRVLYQAAQLASIEEVVVCSVDTYFSALRDPTELGVLSARYVPVLCAIMTGDGRPVVPCSFDADMLERLKPDAVCCACGGVTSKVSLCRCGAHVRCGDEACITSCDAKCEASLSQRAEICAKLKGCKVWPFTLTCFYSDDGVRIVPVPLAQMLRDGCLCRIPSFVAMDLHEDDTYYFGTHAHLIGAELATATLRACASVCVKGGRAERRR